MTEIKLTKRYPQSRAEDITDAFMRGYEQGKKDGLKVGKQIVLGAFETYITADRKTEPQTDTDFTLTYTCSFSDCENFKHFGFGEKCIEYKRKQSKAMRKTEPQTDIHDLTDCDFCKERNCKDCEGGKDEPQTDYSWR